MAGFKNALVALVFMLQTFVLAAKCKSTHWVDIWGTMPQLVEPANLPNPPYNGSNVVFQDATLRQTVYITQDASTIRLTLTNVFGGSDLPITQVTVARPANLTAPSIGAGTSTIDVDTLQTLTFSGNESIIIPNGARAVSEPIDFNVTAQSVLTISIYLATGQTTNFITGHPGSRTTSYFAPGNQVSAYDVNTSNATQNAAHWYFIDTIEAWQPASYSAVSIVGDSITDGRGSTTNQNNRWPDQLLARLQAPNSTFTHNIALINEAAGGNRILADGLGPNALGRIDRDVLAQSGIKYAMIYEGVNDIGTAATDAATQEFTGSRVIQALDQIATRVHAMGIPIFGCTITPFSGLGQTYSDPNREIQRQRINTWIRTSGRFDGVVDFDVAARDPANNTQLNPLYNSGDYLHLNPLGYSVLAAAVDLNLFKEFANGVVRET